MSIQDGTCTSSSAFSPGRYCQAAFSLQLISEDRTIRGNSKSCKPHYSEIARCLEGREHGRVVAPAIGDRVAQQDETTLARAQDSRRRMEVLGLEAEPGIGDDRRGLEREPARRREA